MLLVVVGVERVKYMMTYGASMFGIVRGFFVHTIYGLITELHVND